VISGEVGIGVGGGDGEAVRRVAGGVERGEWNPDRRRDGVGRVSVSFTCPISSVLGSSVLQTVNPHP
jgi:hypothetical protein